MRWPRRGLSWRNRPLFYGGLVRKKNVLGTMMQSFALMALVTVLWAVAGISDFRMRTCRSRVVVVSSSGTTNNGTKELIIGN